MSEKGAENIDVFENVKNELWFLVMNEDTQFRF